MKKEEEQRLRDEIDYLSNSQEYDKFNYETNTSNILGIITIIISAIALSTIIIDFQIDNIETTLILIIILIFEFVVKKRFKNYKEGRRNYRTSFEEKSKRIKEIYNKLF